MKKRMKKALAEYNKIMNDVSYGLDVLAKVNAEVSRCENRLQMLAEICDFDTMQNGASIIKRVDELEKKYKNLRIDTHEDNIPMRSFLLKHGFVECGIIYLENGEERIAYHKVISGETENME